MPVSGPLSREVINWRCRTPYCGHIDGDGKESAPMSLLNMNIK